MRELLSEICIFSVARSNLSEWENLTNYIETADTLKELGIPFTAVRGVYKGVREDSFIVAREHEEKVQEYCRVFAQDCYLVSDSERISWLVDAATGEKQADLGKLIAVPEDVAKARDSYTWNFHNNTYYITEVDSE